jgi:hypothetical protein
MENMRLGAVQGLLADADGTTIYNWATEFGQTIPAEVDFDLDAASRQLASCAHVRRGGSLDDPRV